MKTKIRLMEEKDIDTVVSLRLCQLSEEGADQKIDIAPALTQYFREHLADGSFFAHIAVYGEKIIATSGMSIVAKPPYYSNPSGMIGLVSGMYTLPEFRRRGISKQLLTKNIEKAKTAGCGEIQVSSSEAGIPLYLSYGFSFCERYLRLNI